MPPIGKASTNGKAKSAPKGSIMAFSPSYIVTLPTKRNTRSNMIKFVCVSDTHGLEPEIPEGDVLIHAGDMAHRRTEAHQFDQIQGQLDWLKSQPHPYKFVIAGNHDLFLDFEGMAAGLREDVKYTPGKQLKDIDWGDLIYLQDSHRTIKFPNGRKLKFWGCPQTRQFKHSHGFQYSEERSAKVWENRIPRDTDVLITHCPPEGYLHNDEGKGDQNLTNELEATKPLLHVFGHIHEGHGQTKQIWSKEENQHPSAARLVRELGGEEKSTILVNAAMYDMKKDPFIRPIVVSI